MKNAFTILKKVEKIKEKVQNISVILEITASVCGKPINFLKEKGIKIISA